jgi:hypothetical protein
LRLNSICDEITSMSFPCKHTVAFNSAMLILLFIIKPRHFALVKAVRPLSRQERGYHISQK